MFTIGLISCSWADILGKLTSVAPCDQSRTEKVSLGSLGGFQLGCGSGMVGGGDYLPLLRKIAVLELKTWDSERVPSCAAPHCLRVLWFWMFLGSCAASKIGVLEDIGEAKGTKWQSNASQ